MTLRLKVSTKELKEAVSATEAMAKKIPNDIAAGDAFAAILRREDGFSWVSVHDYFTLEVRLPSMVEIGHDDEGILVPWDGKSNIDEAPVLGIYGINTLTGLMSKIGNVKELVLSCDEKKRVLHISSDDGKEYDIEMSLPRKLMANYATICGQKSDNLLLSLNSDQLAWLGRTIGKMGAIVKPSVSHPGFGNVVICAFPTDSKTLTLSGNSQDEGYSVICTSTILAHADFTVLLPKGTAEGISTFLAKMKDTGGNASVYGTVDEDKSVNRLFIENDKIFATLVCKKDMFPFAQLDNIAKSARVPYCVYKTSRDEIKKTVDRIAVFAKTDDAVTEVNVLDGGSVEMIQRKGTASRERPAREICSSGVLSNFPEKIPSLGTSVKTNVLKGTLNGIDAKTDIDLVVCESVDGKSRRMAFLSNDEFSEQTAVLLGLRADLA